MMWPSMQKVAGVRASLRRGRATRGMSMEGGAATGVRPQAGMTETRCWTGTSECASELAWRNEGNNEANNVMKEMKEQVDVQD